MEIVNQNSNTSLPRTGRETSLAASDGSQGVSLFIPKDVKPAVDRCLKRYGSYENFVSKLNVGNAGRLVANWQDDLICVPDDGNGHVLIPTLEIAAMAFSYQRIQAWLMAYIANVNSFFLGVDPDKKMPGPQIEDASGVIIDAYGKTIFVTEIPVIFTRIKAGRYGKAYGVVDGGMILNCIQQYLDARMNEKAEILRKRNHEKALREAEEDKKKPRMSIDEWKKTRQYAELDMQGKAEDIEGFARKMGLDILKDDDDKKKGDGEQENS